MVSLPFVVLCFNLQGMGYSNLVVDVLHKVFFFLLHLNVLGLADIYFWGLVNDRILEWLIIFTWKSTCKSSYSLKKRRRANTECVCSSKIQNRRITCKVEYVLA